MTISSCILVRWTDAIENSMCLMRQTGARERVIIHLCVLLYLLRGQRNRRSPTGCAVSPREPLCVHEGYMTSVSLIGFMINIFSCFRMAAC